MGKYSDKCVVVFGVGYNMHNNINKIDPTIKVSYFCDNNPLYWDTYPLGDEKRCISLKELESIENAFVLIAVYNLDSIKSIQKQLDNLRIPSKTLEEEAREYLAVVEEKDIQRVIKNETYVLENIKKGKIKKFFDCSIATEICNLSCEYCYIRATREFNNRIMKTVHSPKFIRKALSVERLGGTCLFNLCAGGETLLSKDVLSISKELLEEGHYVSIVTNGTIAKRFDEILELSVELQARLFIKFSFHYIELKKRKLLNVFWQNVNKIRQSACSFTLEITPYDGLNEHIDEVKEEFNREMAGAQPHLTFARNQRTNDFSILSELPLEEYNSLWGAFESPMFKFKSSMYNKKIQKFCYGGHWSYALDLYTGNLKGCWYDEIIGNIYEDISMPLPVKPIAHKCKMPYCYNSHTFLTLGVVPEIKAPTYLQMRDREDRVGRQWIKPTVAAFYSQKLYDNNYQYGANYEFLKELFNQERGRAIILFNSPDYPNIGDHAIALAERKMFEKYLGHMPIIEITNQHYMQDKGTVKQYIREDDLLVVTGGGFLGSLWLHGGEEVVRDIIKSFPNNKIVILPQTIFFEDSEQGRIERENTANIYNAHNNLSICCRDEKSYKLAEEIFDKAVRKYYMPDMVTMLNYSDTQKERKNAVLCLRDDKESMLSVEDKAVIEELLFKKNLKITKTSMWADENFKIAERHKYIEDKINQFKTAEVVITDTLHCMLFCAISGTPCVAMNNVSSKVEGVYRWIQDLPYIQYIDDINNLDEQIEAVRAIKECKYNNEKFEEHFERLSKVLE